ncbi:hypothetical protein L6R52_22030 [Myxococcota bacterium]|nr:hypothetical protein [Myxococcota bacterium]
MFGLGAGAAIAIAAKRPLSRTYDPLHTRYFAVTALWSTALLAPAGLVLYGEFPDWSLMYLANPAHLSPLLMFPLVLVLYLGAPLAGFLATYKLLALEDPRWLRGALVALGVALVSTLVLGADRLTHVAYYDAFHGGGERIDLSRSPLLLALLPCAVAISGILAFVVVSVRRHADVVERLPPDPRALETAASDRTLVRPPPGQGSSLPRPPHGATPGG